MNIPKFTTTKYMSEADKQQVYKHWVRFVDSFFAEKNFTEKLYNHLHLHCSFIAHYDKHGFYGTYFTAPEETMKFLQQFDNEKGNVSYEYGARYWKNVQDYEDINQAMIDYIQPKLKTIYKMLNDKLLYRKKLEAELLRREIAELEQNHN